MSYDISSLAKGQYFFNWTVSDRDGEQVKVPYDPISKSFINAHDPANWTDFNSAVQTGHPVGYELTAEDDHILIDLDGVRDPVSGEFTQEALNIFTMFPGAFMELSVSGTGAHIVCRANVDVIRETRSGTFPGQIYVQNRFIAMTFQGAIGSTGIDGTAALQTIYQHYGFKEAADTGQVVEYTERADDAYTGPDDDDDLLKRMENSRGSNAAMFGEACHVWDLFTAYERKLAQVFPAVGRRDMCSYDRSSADASLMGHLAYWTGRNPARMARLFKRSNLYRPEKHNRSGEYHIKRAIGLANRSCNKVYDKPIDKATESAMRAGIWMSISEQQEYFKGCVYVIDEDKIYTPKHGLLGKSQFNAVFSNWGFAVDPDGKVSKKAWEAFTENRAFVFPKCEGTVFDPNYDAGLIIDDKVNLWKPPTINTRNGDISPFINHVRKLLPNGDDADILLTWMQAAVREPGRKLSWAPVIQGTEGNGKTLIGNVMKDAVGERYFHVPRPGHIAKEQNSWLKDILFAFVEEIHIEGKREILDALKPMISNKYLEIRGMGIEAKKRRNFTNFMFFTNFKDAISVNADTRRYCILFTAQQSKEDKIRDGIDKDYFKYLYHWIENGGQEIINDFLRYAPIVNEKYNPMTECYDAPETTSTTEAIQESLTSFQNDILDAINTVSEVPEIINGHPVITKKHGIYGFRNGWIATGAFADNLNDVPRSGRAVAARLRELGYYKVSRCTRKLFGINNTQGRLYFKHPEQLFNLDASQITDKFEQDQQ